MAKDKRFTRRQVLLLGLGSFASGTALPIKSKLKDLKNQFQTLQAERKTQNRNWTEVGNATLRSRATAKKLIYGVASSYSTMSSDEKFANIVAKESAMLVADTDLLWSFLRPSPNQYNFQGGDWQAEFAQRHNMLFGATHLVWHDCLPTWFKHIVNQQNARQILLEHVDTVVRHYAGKVHYWTVVNEAIKPSDGRTDGLRNSPWLKLVGTDYIDMTFRAAAQADPNALLVYNDAGLEYDNPIHEANRTAVLKLLERLKSQGTPIHALGMQTHVWYDTNFKPEKLQNFLRDVADLGLKILVTEMDVIDRDLPSDIKVRDRIVAAVYEDILTIILAEPAVLGVITWGLSDKYTWLSWAEPRSDGAPVRPLPLDLQMHRKLAWNAVARTFDKAAMHESSSMWTAWEKLREQA